jgi:hypothetical protein
MVGRADMISLDPLSEREDLGLCGKYYNSFTLSTRALGSSLSGQAITAKFGTFVLGVSMFRLTNWVIGIAVTIISLSLWAYINDRTPCPNSRNG